MGERRPKIEKSNITMTSSTWVLDSSSDNISVDTAEEKIFDLDRFLEFSFEPIYWMDWINRMSSLENKTFLGDHFMFSKCEYFCKYIFNFIRRSLSKTSQRSRFYL